MRPIYLFLTSCNSQRSVEFAQLVRLSLVDGGGEVGQRGRQLHEDVGGQPGHHFC